MCNAIFTLLTIISSATCLQLSPSPWNVGAEDATQTSTLSRRAAVGVGAAAALGLRSLPAKADDISPAKAKILALKAAEDAKKGTSKVQAVADSSAQGRSGKAQSAQQQQKRIAQQQEREKLALAAERAAQREYEKANEKPPSLPDLSSLMPNLL